MDTGCVGRVGPIKDSLTYRPSSQGWAPRVLLSCFFRFVCCVFCVLRVLEVLSLLLSLARMLYTRFFHGCAQHTPGLYFLCDIFTSKHDRPLFRGWPIFTSACATCTAINTVGQVTHPSSNFLMHSCCSFQQITAIEAQVKCHMNEMLWHYGVAVRHAYTLAIEWVKLKVAKDLALIWDPASMHLLLPSPPAYNQGRLLFRGGL